MIAEHARTLVGVPFAHCGRTQTGLDCVGVVLASCRAAGVDLGDYRGYSRQQTMNDATAMLSPILTHFDCVPRSSISPGDLLLFSVRGVLTHVGVFVGENQFVHAYEGSLQKVILDRLTHQWRKRLKGVFRLK